MHEQMRSEIHYSVGFFQEFVAGVGSLKGMRITMGIMLVKEGF